MNFPLVQRYIGPLGRLIGLDLTDSMLALAQQRVARHGWRNVELVRTNTAAYRFPKNVNGIFSTFALTLIPEYDRIIREGAAALAPMGRLVVLDFKKPARAPMWAIYLGLLLTRSFGVSLDLAARHPWESIDRYLHRVTLEELYFGFAYIAAGERLNSGP